MAEVEEENVVQFNQMGLHGLILKSLAQLGWKEPTLIQEKTIPLALDGKDILGRGRTGSGKTGAFIIPILHNLLTLKKTNSMQVSRCVVLAPSKELCSQIYNHSVALNSCSSRFIRIADISKCLTCEECKPLLIEKPDIIISTPSKLLLNVQGGLLNDLKETLKYLVIDEADLMFSFGFEKDIQVILPQITPVVGCQCFLMSATLTADVAELKKIVLHNPVLLKLEEPNLPENKNLIQYHVQCEEEDKFVLIVSLFKLSLIKGKTIIFVNHVNRCYKLKLFIEQFGVRSCVLNPELPVSTRSLIIDQFNNDIYDLIIASDEKCLDDPTSRKGKKLPMKRKADEEYGVSRGIDFQFVSNVINFDFPETIKGYVHRVGRTARGQRNAEGTVLSFISMEETIYFEQIKEAFGDGSNFKPYQFKMEELESFRYRSRDALRAVTTIAIREARIKEIKKEILTSNKLKAYFNKNPKDLKILRHDRALHTVRHQNHLKDIPEYIVPQTLRNMVKGKAVKVPKSDSAEIRPMPQRIKLRKSKSSSRSNPLKTFAVNEYGKTK